MRATALVAAGGASGAALRWWVADVLTVEPGTFPWATLLVNLAGCLAIGSAAGRLRRNSDAWHALVVGVLGGLTTYSAFAVEVRSLVDHGRTPAAAVYVAVSVLAGVGVIALAKGRGR